MEKPPSQLMGISLSTGNQCLDVVIGTHDLSLKVFMSLSHGWFICLLPQSRYPPKENPGVVFSAIEGLLLAIHLQTQLVHLHLLR